MEMVFGHTKVKKFLKKKRLNKIYKFGHIANKGNICRTYIKATIKWQINLGL